MSNLADSEMSFSQGLEGLTFPLVHPEHKEDIPTVPSSHMVGVEGMPPSRCRQDKKKLPIALTRTSESIFGADFILQE